MAFWLGKPFERLATWIFKKSVEKLAKKNKWSRKRAVEHVLRERNRGKRAARKVQMKWRSRLSATGLGLGVAGVGYSGYLTYQELVLMRRLERALAKLAGPLQVEVATYVRVCLDPRLPPDACSKYLSRLTYYVEQVARKGGNIPWNPPKPVTDSRIKQIQDAGKKRGIKVTPSAVMDPIPPLRS